MKDRCKCGAWSALDHDNCPKCGEQVDVHGCKKCGSSMMIWDDRCYSCSSPNPQFKNSSPIAQSSSTKIKEDFPPHAAIRNTDEMRVKYIKLRRRAVKMDREIERLTLRNGWKCKVCQKIRPSDWFAYRVRSEITDPWIEPACGLCSREMFSIGPFSPPTSH